MQQGANGALEGLLQGHGVRDHAGQVEGFVLGFVGDELCDPFCEGRDWGGRTFFAAEEAGAALRGCWGVEGQFFEV